MSLFTAAIHVFYNAQLIFIFIQKVSKKKKTYDKEACVCLFVVGFVLFGPRIVVYISIDIKMDSFIAIQFNVSMGNKILCECFCNEKKTTNKQKTLYSHLQYDIGPIRVYFFFQIPFEMVGNEMK